LRLGGDSGEPLSGGFDFRKEARISLGIQKRRVSRIPSPTDIKRVLMRDVSNFHRRNLIVTRGAPEFWMAKIAATIISKKAT